MKKLLMALVLLPLMAAAEVQFTYEQNGDGTIALTGINGAVPSDLLVPSRYDGREVTSVGSGFAKDVSTLRSVTISEGILSIGSKAFSGCGNLQSVTFPASLTTVYDRAFTVDGRIALEGKCQLRHISVAPENRCFQMNGPVLVDLNRRSAILAQRDASEVSLPDYVETIERRCFSGCGKLTKVIGGVGLRRISEEAFLFCRKLTTVQLMGTRLESIRKKAFSGCDSLVSIEIPESLSELSAHAFRWCNHLAKCIFHGDAPAVVLEQEEDGWGVAKDYVYVTSNANLDPIRFPWNDYYSGARVLDSVVTYVDPETHGWGEVPGVWQGRPIRYVSEGPIQETFLPGEAVSVDTGLIGYTAKGLPSGLKYDKKTGKITGAAKKPTAAEGVTVKFTKKGEPDAERTIVVGPMPKLSISLEGDTEKCKVKGAGAYLVGKKVSLSATAPKGTAFAGWFADGAPWPNAEESKNAKLSYVMTKADVSLVAKFEKEQMSVGCAGLEGKSFTVGVAGGAGIPLEIETQSGVKSVKVSKLPAGMKYNAKTGLIEGTPTKAGDYTVQIAVTAKSGAVEKRNIAIHVDPLPDWAVGTFEGAVRQIDYDADGNVVFDGEDLHNWYDIVATVSVDTKGKISGKLTFPDKKTLAVKLNVLTAVEPGICIAEGDVMVKMQRYAVRAVFGAGSFQFADGVVTMGRCDLSIILQGQPTTCFRTDADRPLVQTFWSRKELKGRALQMGLTAKSGFDVENATGEDVEFSGVVKVSDKGVAKLTCTVNGTKSTASGTLLPVGPDVADGFAASVSIKISRTSFRAVKLLFVPTAEGWVVKAVCW